MRRLPRFLVLALLVARSAGAEPVVELDWTAPPGCPDGAAARAAILRWLGEHRQPSGVTARVVITQRSPDEWAVELELGGTASGQRRLTAVRCELAAQAAALIVAFAIDPQAASAVSDALEPAPLPSPVVPAAPPPPPPPPARPPPSAPWHGRLGLFAAAERGYSPELAPGAWIAIGVERGWVGAELRGGWHAATAARSPDGRLELWQLGADLRGCLRGEARFSPSLCLGLRGTRLQARGLSLAEGYERSVLALAAVGGVGVEVRLAARVRVELVADVLVLMTRPRFVLENRRGLYRPSPIGFAPSVGLVYRW